MNNYPLSKIDWQEQFRVKPRLNTSIKHEVIKTLLVRFLIEKYKGIARWIRIYTEYPVGKGKICDVYFENIKTKSIIAYEIQRIVSREWLEVTNKHYEKWEKLGFKTDWCLIKESQLSDDIDKLSKELTSLIV